MPNYLALTSRKMYTMKRNLILLVLGISSVVSVGYAFNAQPVNAAVARAVKEATAQFSPKEAPIPVEAGVVEAAPNGAIDHTENIGGQTVEVLKGNDQPIPVAMETNPVQRSSGGYAVQGQNNQVVAPVPVVAQTGAGYHGYQGGSVVVSTFIDRERNYRMHANNGLQGQESHKANESTHNSGRTAEDKLETSRAAIA